MLSLSKHHIPRYYPTFSQIVLNSSPAIIALVFVFYKVNMASYQAINPAPPVDERQEATRPNADEKDMIARYGGNSMWFYKKE